MKGGLQGTNLQGRFWPTDKAYEALGLIPPSQMRRAWWRRLLRRV